MRPIEKVYWLRFALGIVAALVCTGFGLATNTVSKLKFDITDLMNGIALALITYLISYYAIKAIFITKVQRPQKLFTTGIGVYLLSWIVFWVLLYTFLAR
jgi:predicted cation transporter